MKKLFIVTLIFFIQSFSSYGEDNVIGKRLHCTCLDDWKIDFVPQNDYCQTGVDKELQLKEIFFEFNKNHVLFHYIKKVDDRMEVTKKKLSKLKRTSRYLIWFDKKDEYNLQRDNLNLTVFLKNKKYKEESYYKCNLLGEQENIPKKLKRISLFLQDELNVIMSKNKI